jgi:type II secretory pathway component PulL
MLGMNALVAHVKNGRLVLDEPTDLPEGQVIELVPLDEVLATEGDDLDDEERAALHRSIDESIEDEQAGNVEDLSKIIAELRAQS